MAGIDNLKPFQKGDDPRRNSKGRPGIVKDLRNYIRERLAEKAAEGTDTTRLDAITSKLLTMAFNGNMKAMELCLAYGYGKPVQGLELSGKDGAPIQSHDFTNLNNDELKERILQLKAIDEQLAQTDDPSDNDSTGEGDQATT